MSTCSQRIPIKEFYRKLFQFKWILTPRGSFPASYFISEAVLSGGIPIYVYNFEHETYRAKKNIQLKLEPKKVLDSTWWDYSVEQCLMFHFVDMPFKNVVNWTKISFAIQVKNLDQLPAILNSSNIVSIAYSVFLIGWTSTNVDRIPNGAVKSPEMVHSWRSHFIHRVCLQKMVGWRTHY